MGFRYDGNHRGGSYRPIARFALLAVATGAATTLFAAPAHADTSRTGGPSSSAPSTSTQSTSMPSTSTPSIEDQANKPGVPQPVADGSFGYIATPSATRWMADRQPENIIANLPVGHREDNRAMAGVLGGQLDAAVAERGACVQVIVGGPRDGGLFTYGFYAVEPEYCPR